MVRILNMESLFVLKMPISSEDSLYAVLGIKLASDSKNLSLRAKMAQLSEQLTLNSTFGFSVAMTTIKMGNLLKGYKLGRGLLSKHMSRLMTKSTKWHVRPAKPQISLGIRPV